MFISPSFASASASILYIGFCYGYQQITTTNYIFKPLYAAESGIELIKMVNRRRQSD